MKNVATSLHFIRAGLVGGVENAAYNLVRGLVSAQNRLEVGLLDSNVSSDFLEWIRSQSAVKIDNRGRPAKFIPKNYQRFGLEKAYLEGLSDKKDATILPNYFTPKGKFRNSGALFTIVHDLQHRHYPEFFPHSKRIWLEYALRTTFRRADRVIFISNATKEDAELQYPSYRSDRWVVIHNAVNWGIFDNSSEVMPQRPYILSVAHQFPHKNISTLVRAFSSIASDFPEHDLVLVGQLGKAFSSSSAGPTPDLLALAKSLGVGNRVKVTGFITSKELGDLYRGCACFAYPSLFEGFGLPPVEAIGLGAKCIVSGIPVLKEVTDGSADVVRDYLDPNAWAVALRNSLLEAVPANIARQRANAIRFRYDPARIANSYLSLI